MTPSNPINLELNFRTDDSAIIRRCVQELRKVCDIPFDFHISLPAVRNLVTMPEYIDVKKTLILTFQSEADRKTFMAHPKTHETYQGFVV